MNTYSRDSAPRCASHSRVCGLYEGSQGERQTRSERQGPPVTRRNLPSVFSLIGPNTRPNCIGISPFGPGSTHVARCDTCCVEPFDPSGWEFYCGNCSVFTAARLNRECQPEPKEYFELVCETCGTIVLTAQTVHRTGGNYACSN